MHTHIYIYSDCLNLSKNSDIYFRSSEISVSKSTLYMT